MDKTREDMNDFLKKVAAFEKITNQSLLDVWKQKNPMFQPVKVRLDLQEYIPGIFDLVRINPKLAISKIMSVFCYL